MTASLNIIIVFMFHGTAIFILLLYWTGSHIMTFSWKYLVMTVMGYLSIVKCKTLNKSVVTYIITLW